MCRRGLHDWADPANVYRWQRQSACRACRLEKMRRRSEARRAAKPVAVGRSLCQRGLHDLRDPANVVRGRKVARCRACAEGAERRKAAGLPPLPLGRRCPHGNLGIASCSTCHAEKVREQNRIARESDPVAYRERARAKHLRAKERERVDPVRRAAAQAAWRANAASRHARTSGVASRGVTAADMAAVLVRDPMCLYCDGCPSTSVDHVDPLARLGPHTVDNLVGACTSCNSSKGANHPLMWPGRECDKCGGRIVGLGYLVEQDRKAAKAS